MRNHLLVALCALALCACAAPDSTKRGAPPSVRAPSTPQPLTDAPPPLVSRPIPAPGAQPTAPGQRVLALLVDFLGGTFDTVPQAATDGDSTPVRLHSKRIWPERPGEQWLYFEYATKADPTHPFRQRLLRFREAGEDMYADSFKLDDPARWAGEWGKARPFEGLDPATLREEPGCRMLFVKQMEAVFAGGTATDRCPGAEPGSYERSEYYISSISIRSWDRDFDRSGHQVAGPNGPWEFRKIAR